MRDFKVKTSNGESFTVKAVNATVAQKLTLEYLKKDGDYLEMTSYKVNILRTTKRKGAEHYNHPGFEFASYPAQEALRLKKTLFTVKELIK